jgi:hypothetical protein
MHRSRAPSIAPGAFFVAQPWADCITNMPGFNLRQAPAESLLVLQHVGGAVARIPLTDTPYANRDALFDCFPISIWDDPEKDVTHIRWARELWEAMQPFSTGGVYANNLGEEGTERIAAAYRENYARLLALKNKYHPTNFFRLNQNINPATEPIRGTQE